MVGHVGIAKTFELISRDYWWPQQHQFIQQYVKSCDICAQGKAVHHHPYGLLKLLPIPSHCWQSISMDFITDFPISAGHDFILVVVDCLSKMAHFIPCSKSIISEQTASLKLEGL